MTPMIDIKNFFKRNQPEILVGLGIAGMLTSTITAMPATIKATKLVEAEKRRLGRQLTKREIFRLVWKFYVLPFSSAAGGIASTIVGVAKYRQNNAALTAVIGSLETAAQTYKNAVIEEVGEKKAEAIEERIAEKEIKELPSSPEQVGILNTGYGTTLFKINRAYFRSTVERVKSNFLRFSSDMISQNYMSKNDLISYITDFEVEKEPDDNLLGWNISKSGAFDLDDLVFRYFETPWNEIVCVIDLIDAKRPYIDYDKFG